MHTETFQFTHRTGTCWVCNGRELYIDMVLLFDLRSAPKIFTAVADMAEWIMIRRGVSWCLHYIDDFLTAGRIGTPECANNLQVLIATCDYLGSRISPEIAQTRGSDASTTVFRHCLRHSKRGDKATRGKTI